MVGLSPLCGAPLCDVPRFVSVAYVAALYDCGLGGGMVLMGLGV